MTVSSLTDSHKHKNRFTALEYEPDPRRNKEAEIDLAAYNRAAEEFKKDPKTYTLDEVEKELGL